MGLPVGLSVFAVGVAALAIITLAAGVKIVPQGYVYTVERFGRYARSLEASLTAMHATTSPESGTTSSRKCFLSFGWKTTCDSNGGIGLSDCSRTWSVVTQSRVPPAIGVMVGSSIQSLIGRSWVTNGSIGGTSAISSGRWSVASET